MKRHRAIAYLVAVAAVLATGLGVQAGSVTVTGTFNSSQPCTVDTGLTSNYNDSNMGGKTTTVSTVAGIYNFTATDFSGSNTDVSAVKSALGISDTNSIFHAVCIDFTHNVWFGQTGITWEVKDLNGLDATVNGVGVSGEQAKAIAYLWQQNLPSRDANGIFDANGAAIFQMAVWDLIYNGGGTYSQITGTLAPTVSYPYGTAHALGLDGLAATAAQTAWNNRSSSQYNVYALVNTNTSPSPGGGMPPYQSFNFAISGPALSLAEPVVVPLPASAGVGLGMLAGFGGLFGIRKQMCRRRRIA